MVYSVHAYHGNRILSLQQIVFHDYDVQCTWQRLLFPFSMLLLYILPYVLTDGDPVYTSNMKGW